MSGSISIEKNSLEKTILESDNDYLESEEVFEEDDLNVQVFNGDLEDGQGTKLEEAEKDEGEVPRQTNSHGILSLHSIHSLHSTHSEHHHPNHAMEKDTQDFPDGGRGWLVVAGAFCILNTTYGVINTFGEYQAYYLERFPDTRPNILALIGSLQASMIYVTAFLAIPLLKMIGVTATLAIGSVIMVFAMMMISLCTEVWQLFITQGFLYGLGAGLTFFTSFAIPYEWFKLKRALAIGIVASGSSFGGVIWPIAFNKLMKEVGFAWTNRILGFIYMPLLIFATLTIKKRLPAQPASFNFAVLKDVKFILLAVSDALGFFGLFGGLTYITTYAIQLGIDPKLTPYLLPILNAASIVGRILPGYLGDKIGRLNALFPSVILSGIVQFAFWYPARGEALVVIFALSFGVFSGAYISLFPSALGQLFGIKDNQSRLSFIFLVSIPGTLTGTLIGGSFLPDTPNGIEGYNKLIIYSACMMLASGVGVLILRLSISRKLMIFV